MKRTVYGKERFIDINIDFEIVIIQKLSTVSAIDVSTPINIAW